MADELIIEGLHIAAPAQDDPDNYRGWITVDAIVETNFDVLARGATGFPITEICLEIERLCAGESFGYLEAAVVKVVDGLLERFPEIEGIDLTLRSLDPLMPEIGVGSVGARRRRRRADERPLQGKSIRRPRPR